MWTWHSRICRGSKWCIAALIGIAVCAEHGRAELVLRLDASDLSTLSLSTDVTDGDIGGNPDSRELGLKFVESWGQKYGATANPALHQPLRPFGDLELARPTYNPNGLGTGKPSVSFDYVESDLALQGQRLVAPLDNFVSSPSFTVFFVGERVGDQRGYAFGQDMDFRAGGWAVAVAADAYDWQGSFAGYRPDEDASSVTGPIGVSDVPGVHTLIGSAAGNINFASRVGGTVMVNSAPRPDGSIGSASDFIVGDRGGKNLNAVTPFNGRIGEIAIFDTELSASEQDAVRVFLENKWLNGPAPTGPQLVVANALLQAAPPTGRENIARYEFFNEDPLGLPSDLFNPDWTHPQVTASTFLSGVPLGTSALGAFPRSAYLGEEWSEITSEQSPMNESNQYLGFTVTPDAGKEIDPAELAFAIARGEDNAQALNGCNSYGVWINTGNGFQKVGGQVLLGPPVESSSVVPFFYDDLKVDLSSVSPFSSEAEVRIYFWHEGELVDPDYTIQFTTRVDNVRLLGKVQDIGAGGIAGDYNNDGTVNAADYVVWRENEGTNNTLPNNSIVGPIGQLHYNQWRANFGLSGGSGSSVGAINQVPEPSSLVAFTGAVACLCLAQRRRGAVLL